MSPDEGRVRVALSMLTLVPGEMGGSERYARHLVRELGRSAEVDAVAVVPRTAAGFADGVREEVVHAVGGADTLASRLGALARAQLHRRRIEALRSCDVTHYPFTVPIPTARRGGPVVQTLHDVQHRDLPAMFSAAERAYRAVMYDRGARRADAVVTISAFGRERAVATLGLDPAKVHVAPLGVEPVDDLGHGGGGFVLYPARAWPHKNHARLVEAMAQVRVRRPELRLVLTGGGLDGLGDLPDWVERRGHVTDAELEELYRRAECLAFPSLYEGFGLPPLEAMVRGCPVASSWAAALPEVCGDAAVLFDPEDVAAIAAGIETALTSRSRLVPAGLERARGFTWAACAAAHVAVYRAVSARR